MNHRSHNREPALPAMLICPDRELAITAQRAFAESKAFEIISDLRAYPQAQTLEIRIRQAQPEIVLLDLGTDLEAAKEVLHALSSFRSTIHVIGIHSLNDAQVLLESIRAGAGDFLHAPFEAAAQHEAATRVRRLRQPEQEPQQEYGRVVAFSSTKPGSGASTLAVHSALSLKRQTGKRVLLLDFDLLSGSISFALKLVPQYSVLDALTHSDRLDPALWSSLVVPCHGIDVLAAPDLPHTEAPESSRVHEVMEYARMLYDWVVVDLPTAFHQHSLFLMSEADQCYLVSTAELTSLHLGRRAAVLLAQLGFERNRFRMIVNRVGKKENITSSDLEKIFACPIYASIPNDFLTLHKLVTCAEPVSPDTEIGRALERLGGRIAGLGTAEKKGQGAVAGTKPALSEL